jgi:hypothetical protein
MKRSCCKGETFVSGKRREADSDGYILLNEEVGMKEHLRDAEPIKTALRSIQFPLARLMLVDVRNAHEQPGRIGEYGQ